MKKASKLPQTDSITELAKFWDTHDLADFEDQLQEVVEPVFERNATRGSKVKRDATLGRTTTYANARANFAKLCDEVTNDRTVIVISRRGAEDVALVAAAELSSLLETAHLLRSPKNAKRLLKALDRAKAGERKR
jgi:antitoxin YefM